MNLKQYFPQKHYKRNIVTTYTKKSVQIKIYVNSIPAQS